MVLPETIRLLKPKIIAVKLTSKAENFLKKRHPWVFENSITKLSETPKTGDIAIVFSKSTNKKIGIGLYDATSPIRLKMIDYSKIKITIDPSFFQNKIEKAYNKRSTLRQSNTNAYRLIFGENDGFPSFIADVYANVLVVKLYSEIWLPYLKIITEILIATSKTTVAVLRLSRQLQNVNSHNLKDGTVIYGALKNQVIKFLEHGVVFSANVIKGHKTGYFLDHRYNRKHVGGLSKGKTVLDVFSYAGGFSIHALVNGAKHVTSLDISKHALTVAVENAALNLHYGTHKTIVGDAFEVMQELIKSNIRFDIVVIDPPSFAKQQSDIQLAKRKYAQLAQLGTKLTAANGLLVLASCSSRVKAQSFFDLNRQVIKGLNRAFKITLKTEHDKDHPVTFSEAAYLKCGYYRFFD